MPHETVPADIAAAIERVVFTSYLHGTEIGDGTGAAAEARAKRAAESARFALDAAIIRHLAELKAALEMQTSGAA